MSENRWREIAEAVSTEHDSKKVAALAEELIQALDEEAMRHTEHRAQSDEERVAREVGIGARETCRVDRTPSRSLHFPGSDPVACGFL